MLERNGFSVRSLHTILYGSQFGSNKTIFKPLVLYYDYYTPIFNNFPQRSMEFRRPWGLNIRVRHEHTHRRPQGLRGLGVRKLE